VVVITAADRRAFKRCRRAWDFGSRLRQGWEPAGEPAGADPAAAIRAALAVWYFPGMWEWGREIVRPLALEAHRKVVAGWPAGFDDVAAGGEDLLARYFEWAPAADVFTPLRVETDVQVSIPDPADPRHDLAAADGAAVHFSDRVDLLVLDPFNVHWLVQHRIGAGWAAPDALTLDEAGAACCWAWGRSYLGMDIAGVIYNELRTDAGGGPEEWFRRTVVRRGPAELERVRHKLGAEARDMTSAGLAVYPAPAWDVCSTCAFRPPCIALDAGADAQAVLDAGYRPRPPAVEPEGRLGGATWSVGRGAAPPKFGRRPDPGR
jgi:hypothetical protein